MRAMRTLVASLALVSTSAVASDTREFTTYACVGDTRANCESKLGKAEHYRDCAWWHNPANGFDPKKPNDAKALNESMAREICNLSKGSTSFNVNRVGTKSGGACGYGRNKIICYLKPE